ncbi:hypothetical protein BMS3Abin15_00422 [bacterium BMS3Abin15]|nr:hypothetical protein BMS3Abin15_00422 [bacterium BMS3Abin15]
MEKKINILLVEDTRENYEFGMKLLKSEKDFNVELATSYSEAKQKINTHFYDFVVLDVMLPRKDADEEVNQIMELITNSDLSEFARFPTRLSEAEEKALMESDLLPLGVLLMKECIERNIRFVIATDTDHHEGLGHPAAALVRLIANKMGHRVKLYTPTYGKEKEFKKSNHLWMIVIEDIKEIS